MTDVSRLPAPTQGSWNWQERGACRDLDTALFFHPDFERGENRSRRVAQAKSVCGRCPVLDLCREHALEVEEPYGTWGGLDEIERKQMIKLQRRAGRAISA